MGMLFQGTTMGRTSMLPSPETVNESAVISTQFTEIGDSIVYQAMMDSMCALYHGVCAEDMGIVREGLGDMAKSAFEFFKNIIQKIASFIKNTFNYLMSFVLDFDKFIDKYKDNQSKFKEFEVQGYEYTIDEKEVDNCGIDKIIGNYNSNVEKVKKMEMGDLQKMIVEEKSKDTMDKLRGQIVGSGGQIKADKFEDALLKKYRGGKTSKITVKVNSSTIGNFIDDFRQFKKLVKDTKEEGFKIQSLLSDLADFFKNMPEYNYKDSNTRKIQHYRLSSDTKSGDLKTDKTNEENYESDYYKKLTAYYNFCFRMTKDIMAIYTRAYTAKVNALKEAISFYKGVIRKALSPFNEKEEGSKSSAKESSISFESFEVDMPLSMEEKKEAIAEFNKYAKQSFPGRTATPYEFVEVIKDFIGRKDNIIFVVQWTSFDPEWEDYEKAVAQIKKEAEFVSKRSKKYRYEIVFTKSSLMRVPDMVQVFAYSKKRTKISENVEVPDISTDYCQEATDAFHMQDIDTYFENFNQYMNEVDVLGNAYLEGMVLMEEVEINGTDDTGKNDDRNIFEKIWDFIKRVANSFLDKAKNLFTNNKEWFEKNKYKFDELGSDAYSKLKVTIVDYEAIESKGGYVFAKYVKFKMNDQRLGTKGFTTFEELSNQMFPDMCKLSMSKDIKEGAKIFYRGGSNNLVKKEGNEVNTLVEAMLKYCGDYVNRATDIKDQIERTTSLLDKEKEAAKESSMDYSIAEGCLIQESVFAMFPWIDAEGNAQFLVREGTANGGSSSGGEGGGAGTAPVGGVSGEGEAPKGDTSKLSDAQKKAEEEKQKKAAEEAKAKKAARVVYARVMTTVASAMLTIAEERYVRYIKTLRDILSAAQVTDKKEPEGEKK